MDAEDPPDDLAVEMEILVITFENSPRLVGNPALCTTIKNRGIKIAVLYTTYLPLPTNAFYNANVAPIVNTINPAMQSCALPGLFFEVSPTQGIAQAMQILFDKTIAQAHLAK
jgi:hypothetical protein